MNQIDLNGQVAVIDGEDIRDLTLSSLRHNIGVVFQDFRLLDHLMQHPGRVFSREQLLDAVWGSDVYVEARTVDVHVGRLRKALILSQGDLTTFVSRPISAQVSRATRTL